MTIASYPLDTRTVDERPARVDRMEALLKVSPIEWLSDWTIANYGDNRTALTHAPRSN